MLKDFIVFYNDLLAQTLWQPAWLKSEEPDELHFHRRRFTESYRLKQRKVRTLWLISSTVMLIFPLPAIIASLSLFTVFLSFSLLDETD